MRVAGIIKDSVVNGSGIRDVIFLQGCNHFCKGCHNPETWNSSGGKEYTIDELLEELKDSPNDVTISGGEPLLQFVELLPLLKRLNEEQNKFCWLYTGYEYENITFLLLVVLSRYVDVLVDGKFEIDKKDPTLQFRGSSNQRLIDLPTTITTDKLTLWEDKNDEQI